MAAIVVITSSQLRHRYFVKELAARHDLVGLIMEEAPPAAGGAQPDDPAVAAHFAARSDKERYYFGAVATPGAPVLLDLPYGGANDPAVAEVLEGLTFDCIVLYGSSIIREPLLSRFQGRIINMHLGLSPYYRGTATNFWPLVNREPHCVGVTIHHAVLKVDAGEILAQARPEIILSDRCHDYGCKSIIAGTELMSEVIARIARGNLPAVPQPPGGRLYRTRDFVPETVQTMLHNFATGMNEEYLAEKAGRDACCPIVGLP